MAMYRNLIKTIYANIEVFKLIWRISLHHVLGLTHGPNRNKSRTFFSRVKFQRWWGSSIIIQIKEDYPSDAKGTKKGPQRQSAFFGGIAIRPRDVTCGFYPCLILKNNSNF